MNDELRERCIEAMAQAMADVVGERPDWQQWLPMAAGALDALLAVEGTCQTCGGTKEGESYIDQGVLSYEAGAPIRVFKPCKTCGGSGSDGTPALVGMLMEQVGWAGRDSLETAGAWGYWITDAKRERIEAEPVYRVRPAPEEESLMNDETPVEWWCKLRDGSIVATITTTYKGHSGHIECRGPARVRPDTEGEK